MKTFKVFCHREQGQFEKLPDLEKESVRELIGHVRDFHKEMLEANNMGQDINTEVSIGNVSTNHKTTCFHIVSSLVNFTEKTQSYQSFHYTAIEVN